MNIRNRFLEAILAFQIGCAGLSASRHQDSNLAESSKVIIVKPQAFKKEVLESRLPIFLYIHAQDCPPCDNLYDNLLALYGEYHKDVKFCRMNIETEGVRKIIKQETTINLTGYPTVFFFDKGQMLIFRDYGYSKKENIKNDIDRILLKLYEH